MIKNHENLLEYFKGKRIYMIVHIDLDGIGCLLLAKYYIEPIALEFDYLISNYDFTFIDMKKIENCDIVLYTDISPSKELYDKIKALGKEQLILDHHMTAYSNFNGIVDNFYWTDQKCGTKILFDELMKNKRVNRCIYNIVELINVYDLWQTASALWQSAKSLSNCMFEYANYSTKDENKKFELFIENQMYKFNNFKTFSFTNEEKQAILNAEKKERKALESAKKSLQKRIDGEGNKYIFFECMTKLSYVASALMKEYADQDIQYYICRSLYAYNRGDLGLSIRSSDGSKIDCSKIAEKFGGGGHTQASGIDFKTDQILYHQIVSGKKHLL